MASSLAVFGRLVLPPSDKEGSPQDIQTVGGQHLLSAVQIGRRAHGGLLRDGRETLLTRLLRCEE